MPDDIDRALDIGKNGAGAPPPGPKVLGQIVISLVELGPGQTGTNLDCSIADELQARGLYQKGAVLLEMALAQRAAQAQPRVVGGSLGLPPGSEILKRLRRHAGS